jgi:hypothetical protein
MSAQVTAVAALGQYPLLRGREMAAAVQFLETGLLWLEAAIGGAKDRLLPEGDA